jgi:phosphoglycerate dehydrogenase-like enzyme
MENVLITPHCADISDDSYASSVNIFLENLMKFSKDEQLPNLCNKYSLY